MAILSLLLAALVVRNALAVDSAPGGAALAATFLRYPFPDYCGMPFYPRDGGRGGGQSCPFDICVAERQRCEAADEIRNRCVSSNCAEALYAAALKDATDTCAAATKCIQKQCYRTAPWNSHGQACRVRSYRSGECCCATCTAQPGFGLFNRKPNSIARAFLPMFPFTTAMINDKADLSSVITGRNGAAVSSIRLEWVSGPLMYKIIVKSVNQIFLYFTDMDDTVHSLVTPSGTTNTTTEMYYNAIHAGIKCIQWSSTGVRFPGCF